MLGLGILGYDMPGNICCKRPHEDDVVEVEVFKDRAHYVRERSKNFDNKGFFFLCTYIHSPSPIFFSRGDLEAKGLEARFVGAISEVEKSKPPREKRNPT